METRKKTENITGTKAKSKLPRSTKLLSVKGTVSNISIARNTAQISKTKTATITSSKLKQTQNTRLPKNMKRMSVAKVSEDVLNHFRDENLNNVDEATESVDGVNTLAKEITTKRVPLKEHFSQATQKSGNLPKKPSATDLKTCAAFGGIRFTAKRNTHKKDMFQKMTKEAKNCQTIKPPESCTKEQKTTVSTKKNAGKEIERPNEGNLDDLPTTRTESSNAASLTTKQTSLKKCTTFGGMKFTPKWQSTPLKPELFENILKVSKHDSELHLPNSSVKGLETIPNSARVITKEIEVITLDETIVLDETIQPQSEEKNCLKSESTAVKEIVDKLYPAFAGMRITPKRKSTLPKPDIFQGMQEKAKLDGQESPITDGLSEEPKISPDSKEAVLKTENQPHQDKMLEQTSTQHSRFKETASVAVKESNQVAAIGGMRFTPKWKNSPISPDIFESIQKESKTDCLDSNATGASAKEMKAIPASTVPKMKVESQLSDDEKLQLLETQKSEMLKHDEASKNVKKVIPPAFGGLRFKPRQKKLHDIF